MTTTPLPCPFCGHVGLEFREGSSFRWLLAECGSCGASCGETRIQTLGNGNPLEWADAAKADAVKQWNERAPATAPPTPAWHDAQETIALQLELASAKEAYLNACKLVADMHAAAVGGATGPRLGVVEDVAALKTERDELLALLIYASSAIKSEYPESQWSEYRVFEMEAAIVKAEGAP